MKTCRHKIWQNNRINFALQPGQTKTGYLQFIVTSFLVLACPGWVK